jgi:hypothetical protein
MRQAVESYDDLSSPAGESSKESFGQAGIGAQLPPQLTRRKQQSPRTNDGEGTRRVDSVAEQRDLAEQAAVPFTMDDDGPPLAFSHDSHGAGENEMQAWHVISGGEEALAVGELHSHADASAQLENDRGHAIAKGSKVPLRRDECRAHVFSGKGWRTTREPKSLRHEQR